MTLKWYNSSIGFPNIIEGMKRSIFVGERKEALDEIKAEVKAEIVEKHNAKVTFFKSIGMKVALLVVCASIIATLISILMFVKLTKAQSSSLVQNNIGDLATAYSHEVNAEINEKGELSYDDYNAILADVKVKGMDSSYAYLVTSDGIMQYHPTQDKVGNPVENEVVKGLVAELQAGKTPADAVVTYLYKGKNKIAGYSILTDKSILVVTADEDDAYSFMDQVRNFSILLIIGIVILFTSLGYMFAKFLIKPMDVVKDLINETADFNFESKNRMGRMVKRTDEIGSIAKSLAFMRGNLRNVVIDINAAGDTLNTCVTEVDASSAEIDEMCTDTSSTTEELAAGMQETTASTETIQVHIQEMQEEAESIKELSNEGERQSVEIKDRAGKLNQTTKTASTRTTTLYEDMKAKTEKAIADSAAVAKINELTDAIMAISSQTSLLALNANIEAARAGEAGKGFAVVATEIGSLASQTSDTVGSINEIVGVVNEVVSRMAATLTESIDFLENVVIKDYEQFADVSVQYENDAESFKDSMTTIEESVNRLTDKIESVADSLQAISNTIGESTIGVTEIAGKTSDITARTADNRGAVDDCLEAVESLRAITAKFRLG